jgi:hypothetical protein
MRELNQKKKTLATIRPTTSPSLHDNYNKPKHVPFSINSAALSLSLLHKRKLSPLSQLMAWHLTMTKTQTDKTI